MTAPEYDPLAASCSRCGAEPGKRCMAVCDWARKPHAARLRLSLALAAHADPALDALWPHHGPCGICSVPGLGARHRVIDAIAGWLEAEAADPRGTDPQTAEVLADDPSALDGELAAEFGAPAEAVAVVRAWAARWPGAWG